MSAFKQKLVETAWAEHEHLRQWTTGHRALRERIKDYFRDLDLAVPSSLDHHPYDYPWSAVFVCWCMREADRPSAGDFPPTVTHSDYVRRAMLSNGGPFVAKRSADHVPEPGDLVVFNRPNKKLTFDQAHDKLFSSPPGSFQSHGSILAKVEPAAEGRTAVVVMGHHGSSGTVGTEQVTMTANGLLVNPPSQPIICIIAVRK